jgi:hypothetical protein
MFLLYPGLDVVSKAVEEDGKVDVLALGGEWKYRRFSKSRRMKGFIRYEDFSLEQQIVIPDKMQEVLQKCWVDREVPIEDKSTIYLILPDKRFFDIKDQARLALNLAESPYWRAIFEKIKKNNGISNATILQALAEGEKFKGIGDGIGDEQVAMWAIDKLSDDRLSHVVRKSNIPKIPESALGHITRIDILSELVLDEGITDLFKGKIIIRLNELNASTECFKNIYLKSKKFKVAKEVIKYLHKDTFLDSQIAEISLQWLRSKDIPEEELVIIADSITGDKHLTSLVLDKKIRRHFRERALEQLSEPSMKGIYCLSDEYWLTKKVLSRLSLNMRFDPDVIACSRKWFKNENLSLGDRVEFYKMLKDQVYSRDEQSIIARMLELDQEWQIVFKKCKEENAITVAEIKKALSAKKMDVQDVVSLWAVDGLLDDDLLTIIETSPVQKVCFKALGLLQDHKSIEKVALGRYDVILRIEAINRLTKDSQEAFRKIVMSNDPNFRQIALDRISSLGISTSDIKADADKIMQQENLARRLAAEKLRKKREIAIKQAERDVVLAKTDEQILSYRNAINSGSASELRLSFGGRILSIVSKAWKPRIRIEVNGAKEKLYVVCRVSGRLKVPVKEGDFVIAEGVVSKGSEAEVFLSNVTLSISGEGNKK